jgi:hypothetical protein
MFLGTDVLVAAGWSVGVEGAAVGVSRGGRGVELGSGMNVGGMELGRLQPARSKSETIKVTSTE